MPREEMPGFDINVEGATDQPVSNKLEKGRYTARVVDLEQYQSKAGNGGIHVTLEAEGVYVDKWFVLKDVNGKPHNMAFQWRQFLYSIGKRDKRASWTTNSNDLKGMSCKIDVIKKDDDNGLPKNEITFFSPIENAEAPMTDVPPENEKDAAAAAEAKGKAEPAAAPEAAPAKSDIDDL